MVFVIYEVARVAEVRVAGLFKKPAKQMTLSKLKTLPKRIHCEQSKPHIFSKLVLENSALRTGISICEIDTSTIF